MLDLKLSRRDIDSVMSIFIPKISALNYLSFSKIDNRISLCNEGGPELATGGTGDILAGVISAMVAQKLTPHDSCILSTALHARAGKSFNENVGEIGLNASALIPLIRNLLNK